MNTVPEIKYKFVVSLVDKDDGAQWDDGLIGFANDDGYQGPLMINYLYDQKIIQKKLFAI